MAIVGRDKLPRLRCCSCSKHAQAKSNQGAAPRSILAPALLDVLLCPERRLPMKTQYTETASLSSWRLRTPLAGSDKIANSNALPVAVDRTGRPLGWIGRTLVAVDTDRVFIEASDPGLREELVAMYEDEGCDVIATSNSKTLLAFMEQLPVPDDFGDDVVIAEDDFPGTNATDLHRQLLARGWSIPVFTVSTRGPSDRTGVAS
jgi:hypothetical protein